MPREAMLRHLEMRYSEVPAAVGMANNGNLVELLLAPDGLTWTIVLTLPRGVSCLIASGEDWQMLAPPKLGEPS